MPIYDYRCNSCGWTRDAIRLVGERHDGPYCEKCRHQMQLQVSAPRGVVKSPAVPRSRP
jgi:putative FmdB family regulatory protein